MNDYFVEFLKTDRGPISVRANAVLLLQDAGPNATTVILSNNMQIVIDLPRAKVQTQLNQR